MMLLCTRFDSQIDFITFRSTQKYLNVIKLFILCFEINVFVNIIGL